jgi:hypothetical protein
LAQLRRRKQFVTRQQRIGVLTTPGYLGVNMTIERDGFLSPDIAQARDKNRARHTGAFEMVADFNRSAQLALPTIETLPRTKKNLLACGYYIRGLQSLQGAVLVAELGLTAEGYTLLRSGLETLFHLGATIKSEDFVEQLARDHVKRMRTAMSGYKKAVPGGDPEVDTAELEAVLASMLPDGVDPAIMSLEAVAKRAELSALYDGAYRSLSHAHAHPSLLSLTSIWEKDVDHQTKGVRWGPERGDDDELETFLLLVCTFMFYFSAQWGRLLVQAHGREFEFHKRIEQVGEKYRAVLS